jgi:hypothetical protein
VRFTVKKMNDLNKELSRAAFQFQCEAIASHEIAIPPRGFAKADLEEIILARE